MAFFSPIGTECPISSTRRRWSSRLPGIAVGLAALLVAFASAAPARAGVMVAPSTSPNEAVARDAIAGDLASSSTPMPDEPSPLLNEWQGVPLFDGNSPNGGGAGSQTTSGTSVFSVVAVVSESPRTAQSSLISRLALCSRISLPSPLEDRFFRPPR